MAVVKVNDMASLGGRDVEQGVSAHEFFMLFWNKMIDQLERL